ncbi:hypothetical protein DXG01_000805 [Tephrocybe rancida]|nr:hypothetical protein DXG01_000805 [Tephrocybe rancida]
MESLQSRIDSFSKPRRVKNPSKTSSSTSLKWTHPPHPRFIATPETLAEAGFYFNPSFEDRDNVACFMCDKQLADWEAEDDPFDIHWTKCGDKCCWAIVRCGLRGDINRHGGRFTFTDKSRVPTSKFMERARLDTYSAGDGWIHDEVKNHGANSRKMARAGFVFTPQHSGDDLATCLYCNVALSGWEAGDDPMRSNTREEHRKRQEGSCPMFDPPEPVSKPSFRAQSANPASKSKPSKYSRSVSSSRHNDLVQPMKTHDGDADESDATAPTLSSRRSTRTVSGSSRGARTPKPSRSQSRSGLKDVAEDDEDMNDEEAVPRAGRAKAKKSLAMATKKVRSRSKSVASRATTKDEDEVEEVVTKTPARNRSKAKGKEIVDDEEELEEETKALKKSTRGRPPARTKQKEEEPEDEEEVQVLMKSTRSRAPPRVEDTEDEEDVTKTAKKPIRTKLPSRVEDPTAAPRKTRKARKAKAPELVVETEPEVEPEVEADEAVVEEEEEEKKPRAPSKSRAKTPASRKPSRARAKAAPAPAEEPEEEEEELPESVPIVEKKKRAPSTNVKSGSGLSRSGSVTEKPAPPSDKPKTAKSGKATHIPLQDEGDDADADDEPDELEEALPLPQVEPKERAPSSRSSVVAKSKVPQSKTKTKAPVPPSPPPEEQADNIDEDDEMDVFVSPRQSPVPPPKKLAPSQKGREADRAKEKERESAADDEPEMEPLFIPKRGAKPSKPSTRPTMKAAEVDPDVEMEPAVAPKKASRPQVLEKENKPTKGTEVSSSSGRGRKGSILKVVEISSASEDEQQPSQVERPVQEARSVKETRQLTKYMPKRVVETKAVAEPTKEAGPSRIPSPPPPLPPTSRPDIEDVEMGSIEPEAEPLVETQVETQVDSVEEVPVPQTPPRHTVPTPAPPPQPLSMAIVAPAPEPIPMPALSKLPFTPLQNLTDAELDMTVEEWIRYQMEVEYDKFRRDGERELGRFKKRAEEVKGIIERL